MRALLRRTLWAPLAVLVFHAAIARTSWREPLDFWMHFSGGAAAAFCAWHALLSAEPFLGKNTPLGRALFAFALACTVGLFWEFGELLSDQLRSTHIQHELHETLRDLIADTAGALVVIVILLTAPLFRAKVNREP